MIITNRPKNPGQGFHVVKNKRARLPINFDLNSLNLMCTYVLSDNRNIKRGQFINLRNLMELLDMKSRVSFRENYLIPAIDSGVVKMSFPDNPTNKNQTYYKD